LNRRIAGLTPERFASGKPMRETLLALMAVVTIACSTPSNKSSTVPNDNKMLMEKDERAVSKTEVVKGIRISKLQIFRSANITVVLENSSTKSVKLWKDSNSWGAAHWRVLAIRGGKVETFFQNPDQGFTVNFPAYDELPAGEHVEYKLDLNGGNWCGLGSCSRFDQRGLGGKSVSFDSGAMFIVIYDVPASQEARDEDVWYGVITAASNLQ
jgi:hypothetical protein